MREEVNLRIKQYIKGWIVEIKKPKWTLFGIKWVWIPYLNYLGDSKYPCYYKTREEAESVALINIKFDMREANYR